MLGTTCVRLIWHWWFQVWQWRCCEMVCSSCPCTSLGPNSFDGVWRKIGTQLVPWNMMNKNETNTNLKTHPSVNSAWSCWVCKHFLEAKLMWQRLCIAHRMGIVRRFKTLSHMESMKMVRVLHVCSSHTVTRREDALHFCVQSILMYFVQHVQLLCFFSRENKLGKCWLVCHRLPLGAMTLMTWGCCTKGDACRYCHDVHRELKMPPRTRKSTRDFLKKKLCGSLTDENRHEKWNQSASRYVYARRLISNILDQSGALVISLELWAVSLEHRTTCVNGLDHV